MTTNEKNILDSTLDYLLDFYSTSEIVDAIAEKFNTCKKSTLKVGIKHHRDESTTISYTIR